jgi:KipI family sensor histidine kinase inhibitor
VYSLSDSSILVSLGNAIDPEINRRVHLLAAALAFAPLPGVQETVPGYASLVVHYDPLMQTEAEIKNWLIEHINTSTQQTLRAPGKVEVPVTYNGPDLAFVAEHCRLKTGEIIRIHSGTEYTVYMMGFTPGFPYLGKLPRALSVPRLPTPRPQVQAGSVAIAGGQTGIYPINSAGGWRLIGQTSLALYDPQRSPPFLFAPGDTVRFIPE